MSRLGAKVVICDVNGGRAEEALQACGGSGCQAMTSVTDVTDPGGVANMVDATIARWGQIDILCNNAGVMDRVQGAENTELETWNRVMGVNATGTFLMTRAVIPHMLARERGAIVNTASAAGIRGGSAGLAYTASKHAVVGITRSVATMHREQGIRCNAVCPGSCETDIIASAGGPFDEKGWSALRGVMTTLGRTSSPNEVAAAIVFLCSDLASFVSGAILPVDGGWTAG
jgi:NAD(P)-dependent dehydrogenase (short-subunit alcohol dehydrogenase family)